MKRWVTYVIVGVVCAIAIGGVLYGVITHTEPGLMTVCWRGDMANYGGDCEEVKWKKSQMPLKYHIDFGPDHKVYTTSVLEGIKTWNREIGDVFVRTLDISKADVRVSWGDAEPGCSAGHTIHRGGPGNLSADVVLKEPSDTHAVFRFAAHEFGHVLGLEHDEAPRSIMYDTQPGMTQEMKFVLPSDSDKKMLRELYR